LIYQDLKTDYKDFIIRIGGNPEAKVNRHLARKIFDQGLGNKRNVTLK
jgi:hypothetical protein